MSDAYVEAYGRDLNEAFGNAARAVVDTMVDIRKVRSRIKMSFKVEASDLPGLLYNWLEAVLVKITSDGIVFSSFNVEVLKLENGYSLTSIGRGENFSSVRHKFKVEAKAVTYHLMDIRFNKGVVVRFLLDL